MIGLDTNVVVRYLTQDEPQQSAKATALIDSLTEESPGYISVVTLVEIFWVLRRAYRMDVATCREMVARLVDSREIRIGQESAVRSALEARSTGAADFADGLIAALGRSEGCSATLTFDRRAANAGVMELV